jgi:spermidine synthase
VIPWTILEGVPTPEGTLELRRRGERDFLMTVAGRVLMTSQHHRSEDALSELTCEALGRKSRPRVLLGGLGMGFSLRAALDHLPPGAQVVVAELNAKVVDWNRDALAPLARFPLGDARVKIVVADVARLIAEARPQAFDAIIFDLYEGPHGNRDRHPLYGNDALARTHAALSEGGIFSVWSEESEPPFEERLKKQGFSVERHSSGNGGRVHLVYLARAELLPSLRERPGRGSKPEAPTHPAHRSLRSASRDPALAGKASPRQRGR